MLQFSAKLQQHYGRIGQRVVKVRLVLNHRNYACCERQIQNVSTAVWLVDKLFQAEISTKMFCVQLVKVAGDNNTATKKQTFSTRDGIGQVLQDFSIVRTRWVVIPTGNLGGLTQGNRTSKAGSSSYCSLLVLIDSFIYMQTPPCVPWGAITPKKIAVVQCQVILSNGFS